MALTSGFFNSLNGDRVYSALQMGSIFDGIIYDGVYQSYGQAFYITALGALNVSVGTGRGWFSHFWVLNDSALGLTLAASHSSLNRYDEIVLEIDLSDGVRASSIKVIYGTAASSPVRPALTNSSILKQYSLGYIYRAAASSSIAQSNITMVVGTAATPWATSVLANNISFTQLIDSAGFASFHNQVFRGKNLGTGFTAEQKANVQNGTFTDLWVGDYWVIGGVTWRIVDINYWYGLGDTKLNTNHLVIMPDSALYQARMHSSSSTSTGYANSQMRTTNLNTAKTTINAAFPSSVITRRAILSTVFNGDEVTGVAWYSVTVEIPSEPTVLGGRYLGQEFLVQDTNQFAAFKLKPHLKLPSNGVAMWFQNICDSTGYSGLHSKGNNDYYQANDASPGVRPVFAIG